MTDFIGDLRQSVRGLLRRRAFTTAVVMSLALGIGANTAVFTVVSAVVVRPLPFPHPERLVQVLESTDLSPRGDLVIGADLEAFRVRSSAFDRLAGYWVSARYVRRSDGSQRVMTVSADRSFFSALGVTPAAGRTFRADDPAGVAVVSEAFWKGTIGGDTPPLGRSLVLDGELFTIIGVMPRSFQFPYGAASLLRGVASETRTDAWLPWGPSGQPARGRVNVIGRVKGGIPIHVAERELGAIARAGGMEKAQTSRRTVRLVPLSEAVVPPAIRRSLLVLFAAVGIVLVLACANVMNLWLVAMGGRAKDLAMRSALGAGRSRLVRQLLVESVLLSLAGGAIGLALAVWGRDVLLSAAASRVPRAHEVAIDWRVFLFLLTACLATGMLSGLAPAVLTIRTDIQAVLRKATGWTAAGLGRRRIRDTLVIVEVALAFGLSVGAALVVRETARLRATDPGMVTANVLTVHIGERMTPSTDARQFYEIARRVQALPGVRAAGFIQALPLQNWGWGSNSEDFRVRGREANPSQPFEIALRYVTPGYFDALRIPVVKGRGFTPADTRDTVPVILINATLARKYFGGRDPTGEETTRGRIVGVVGDVRQVSLDRPAEPELYYPVAQNWSQVSELGMSLVVRADRNPEPLIGPVRSIAREVNPRLAVFNARTLDDVVEDSLADLTLFLSLIGSFAVLALVLAATGTYSVVASVVRSRMHEFAIRVAVGADRARMTRLVVGQGVRLTVIGLGLGLFGVFAAAPLLQDLPVAIRPPDVLTTAPIAALIGIVAVAACLIPARRAGRVDPMALLRSE